MGDLSQTMRERCDREFGALVAAPQLRLRRAVEVASYLSIADRGPFVHFIEARRLDEKPDREVIIVEFAPELGTERVVDVHYNEFFALVFDGNDDRYPRALAIREDFPRPIHLNFEASEFTSFASLCLYDQPWGDIKLTWTAKQFLNRIGEWLTRASRGELHASDQPLECFMVFSGITLVMPHELKKTVTTKPLVPLNLFCISRPGENWMVFRPVSGRPGDANAPGYTVISRFESPPVTHGLIKACPTTLGELDQILGASGWSVITEFAKRIKESPALINKANGQDARMLIMVAVPLRREDSSEPERTDTWAFRLNLTLGQFAEALNLAACAPGSTQFVPILNVDELKADLKPVLAAIPILPMRILDSIERARAATFTGEASAYDDRVVAIGAGALGSQVVLNLARGGFGRWTIVDEDIVLPHNMVRHVGPSDWIGCSKSAALHEMVSELYESPEFHKYIHANVLCPSPDQAIALNDAALDADHIFDFSASVSVARHLSFIGGTARRSSAFITPSGNGLVVMNEDSHRHIKLDWLEMEFYSALSKDHKLAALMSAPANKIAYGLGCRDRSVVLSQDTLGMFAGVVSRDLRKIGKCDNASLKVYQNEPSTGAISCRTFEIEEPTIHMAGEWEIQYSRQVSKTIQMLRQSKLPDETGGVLLGTWDVSRKRCYIYHALPAPSDSNETPDYFERGYERLSADIGIHSLRTNGMTTYVGEWHSHPNGYTTLPSRLDISAALWFQEQLRDDGLPSVMFIIGDDESPTIVCALSINPSNT